MSEADVLADFPQLTRDDIRPALRSLRNASAGSSASPLPDPKLLLGENLASSDPIVAEVRRVRGERFAAARHDIHEFCRRLREKQSASGSGRDASGEREVRDVGRGRMIDTRPRRLAKGQDVQGGAL